MPSASSVMLYQALADLILLLHFAFILFIVTGGLLALRWVRAPVVHVPAALWGVFIEVSGGICPLTPLENALRHAAGSEGYSGSFIEHYLVPVVYPPGLSHPLQLVLAGVVAAANVAVYVFVWRRTQRCRSDGARPRH